jgi:hypothetical protein
MSKKPRTTVSRPTVKKRSGTPSPDELRRRVDDTLTTEEVKLLKLIIAKVRKLRAQQAVHRSSGRPAK